MCSTRDYEASASCTKMVIPLASDLFEHFDNVGTAQVMLNHSRVQLELSHTYDEAFSPSRTHRRTSRSSENAFNASTF